MGVLTGIMVLLIYQLIGEAVVLYLKLPVPGPVVGMVLLFTTLMLRRRTTESLDAAATAILKHLSLLFVPAGVGVMIHLHRIGTEWLPIGVALLASTILTLAVTALTMKAAARLTARRAGSSNG